jgi:hypothetical protein
MKAPKRQKLLIGLGSLILVLSPCLASATNVLSISMPMGGQTSCISCHNAPNPTAGDDLNPFGLDFLESPGQIWGPELAALDSDSDGCTNGAELGDIDGDGDIDQGVDLGTLTNPGADGDCSAAGVDEATWSELKSLFNGSR